MLIFSLLIHGQVNRASSYHHFMVKSSPMARPLRALWILVAPPQLRAIRPFWTHRNRPSPTSRPPFMTLRSSRVPSAPAVTDVEIRKTPNQSHYLPFRCFLNITSGETMATGWLGTLVRVTKLKFWCLRLIDKMLVFAGVVTKCLQHGHSFRLAGVWLKSENLRFASAVTRFCSSRVKKNIRNLWFSIIRIISGRHSLFQFFPLLHARALVAT